MDIGVRNVDVPAHSKLVNNLRNKGAIFQKPCSTCNAPSKYRCPKCSLLSCSLQCVESHKNNLKCDGVRIKTEFVEKNQFHERHLLNDYLYLEDIGRTVDNVQRAKRTFGHSNYLPINLYRLKKAANIRRTELCILPPLFSKRRISTTYLRYSDRKILWRIEWRFPLSDFTFSDPQLDEEMLLGKCLDKFLLPSQSEEFDSRLSLCQASGHKGVAVLLKDERTPSNQIKYKVLQQNKSLKENFKNAKIIEFPTLLVIPKIHLSSFVEEV